MLNAHRKLIEQLQTVKYRKRLGLFVMEGTKIAEEFCYEHPEKVQLLIGTGEWLTDRPTILEAFKDRAVVASLQEIKEVSSLQTPSPVIVVAEQMTTDDYEFENDELTDIALFLETIQDPGNMGTILRSADWFGLKRVFVSPDCVDIYNPKVAQSSMGSLWRIAVETTTLGDLVARFPNVPRYGATLHGESMFTSTLSSPALLIMGNESKGISGNAIHVLTHEITIPQFGSAESLNVGVATGVLLAQWRR
jgi:RNA methyltransferase, TrmH family